MPYSITFKKRAIKALTKINEPYYSSIKTAIYDLANNPRPFGYIRLQGRDGYRIRVGTYQVIYDIFEQELVIDIINIGSRGGVYEE